ncbi:transcription factor bHLH91-like [Chenopodium quinoa]|uniref:transcription factor bHLH91-like n=1 Tax=Chenopodium quinoa TaxID=63459 RepID=UPI000B77FA07|nr:transcription factor bHLH91-like [Chenopodium quinoa]XP_021759978.1 transcription factor bHLH91-like [Chenopodium quinoa]
MYDQTTEAATAAAAACFDPNNIPESAAATAIPSVNGFISHETNNHNHQTQESDSSMEFQNPNLGNNNNGFSTSTTTTHLPMLPNCYPNDHDPNSWGPTNLTHEIGNGFTHFDENLQPTTDLLTLLHLPRCSFTSSTTNTTSLSFGKPSSPPPPSGSALGFLGDLNPPMMVDNPSGSGSSTISYDPSTAAAAAAAAAAAFSYDPLFHLNLPPQPSPLLRDLMFHQTLPHGGGYNTGRGTYGIIGNGSSSSLFGGLDDGEGNTINGIYQDGDHHIHGNGVFEFSKGDVNGGKCPKNFVTERQRRQNFNDKYQHLRSLVPNQTKGDRASIVWDAINHINELRRTVGELKLLVEKKRMSKERLKRHKTEHQDTPAGGTTSTGGGDHNSNGVDGPAAVKPDPDEEFNGSAAIQLRSSWIQRKCKDTEVDVRIVDDDVTIKLVQRKKINCLLFVSRTLDELQLDLRHVAGGHVGDYYSYLFNSKICEGSSVYASAIANKLIEVVERQYAAASVAVAPTTSF